MTPVSYAIMYRGAITANIRPTRAGALTILADLNGRFPHESHLRKIVPIYDPADIDAMMVLARRWMMLEQMQWVSFCPIGGEQRSYDPRDEKHRKTMGELVDTLLAKKVGELLLAPRQEGYTMPQLLAVVLGLFVVTLAGVGAVGYFLLKFFGG